MSPEVRPEVVERLVWLMDHLDTEELRAEWCWRWMWATGPEIVEAHRSWQEAASVRLEALFDEQVAQHSVLTPTEQAFLDGLGASW